MIATTSCHLPSFNSFIYSLLGFDFRRNHSLDLMMMANKTGFQMILNVANWWVPRIIHYTTRTRNALRFFLNLH
jgi:hypothetical protein